MSRDGSQIGAQINCNWARPLRLGLLCLLCLLSRSTHLSAASPGVSLAWDPNTETNLAGYIIHFGVASGQYTVSNDVGRVTNATVSGLQEGTNYFFVVTAYDSTRLESDPSNEIRYQVPHLTPAISAISAQVASEDTLKQVPFSASAGTNSSSLSLTATSSDSTLVPVANIVLTGSAPNYTARITPQSNRWGTATITIVASNGTLSASRSFVLTVNSVNDAPTISSIASQQTSANTSSQAIPFTVRDVDSSGSSLVLSAASSDATLVPPGNMVFGGSGSNRTVQLTPAAGQTGQATITISVTDGLLTAATTFVLTVSPPSNSPPVISAISAQVTSEDTLKQVPFSASAGTNSSGLSLTATSSDSTLVPVANIVLTGSAPNYTARITPQSNRWGTATITIVASNETLSASRSFVLTVNPVNDVPAISAIASQQTSANTPSQAIPFTVRDVDSSGSSLVLSATSSDATLVPPGNMVFGGSGSNRTVQLTPAAGQTGQVAITISVTDGLLTAATTFVLTVSPPSNSPPVISAISAQVTSEDTLKQVPFSASAGTNSSGLSLTATSSDSTLVPVANIVLTGSAPNYTARITPQSNRWGTATIIIVASNGTLSASRSFVLTVNPVNDVPAISAIASQQTSANTPSQAIPFTVRDVDSSGSSLVLSATSSDATLVPPGNMAFGGSGSNRTVQLTPAAGQTGQATITISVTDGLLTAATTFVLTVSPPSNSPPVISAISAQVTSEDTLKQVPFSASAGTNSSGLSLTATSSDSTLVPVANIVLTGSAPNYAARITPQSNRWGTATITIVASNETLSASRSFVLTVNPVNDAPTISSIASQQTDEDVSLTAGFVIGDRETMSLALSAISTNTALVPNANIYFSGSGNNRTITVVPAPNQFGTTFITVHVSDGVATHSASFVLTVNPVNDFPTLDVIPNFGTASVDHAVHIIPINGISSGATDESQTFVVTAVSSNPSLLPNPFVSYNGTATNGTLALRPGNGQQGNATITVTVTDTGTTNNSFVRTFQVNINAPANIGPTMSIIPNLTTAEDTALGPIAFTVRDSTTAAGSLMLRADSSNPALLPTNNILFGGSGTNRTLTLIPALNQSGVATVFLTVIDTAFGSSNQTFTFTVNAVNDRPAITGLAAHTVAQDTAVGPLAFNVTDRETPSGSLILTAISGNQTLVSSANIVLDGSGANRTVRLTPAAGQTGQASITLSVTDGSLTAHTTFLLTVLPPSNNVPAISAISDQAIDDMTPLAAVPFTVRDAETPAQDLAVSAVSSNPSLVPATNIVIGGSGSDRTVTVIPVPGHLGTVTVGVAVSDGAATVTTSFRLGIRAASPALVVTIQGEGAVLPDLSDRKLTRGGSYSLTARPHPGQIFAGWSGGVTSSAPLLRFTMASNLVLIANFMTNPFTPIRGTYTGLFYEADEVRHERSGFFKILHTKEGAYTGTLGLGTRIHPISGRLDTGRRGTNTIRRTGASALQLEFQLGTDTTLDQATGQVTDGNWVAALLGARSAFHTATHPSPFAGKYTAIIPGNADSSQSPGGDGFGSVTVGPGGNALLTGLTGDSQPLTRSTPLSKDGAWPLYIPLYGGKGSILGWINVTNRSTDDMTGQLSWIRPGLGAAKQYSAGFTNETFLVGSSYLAPATRTNRVMELTNCLVTFSGGNLAQAFTNHATLSANNLLINASSNKMVATVAVSSGLFSGSVINPATGKSLSFRGAVLQKRNAGSGFFPGTNETGRVWLGP